MSDTISPERKTEPLPIRFRSCDGIRPGTVEVQGKLQVVAFIGCSLENGISKERSEEICKQSIRRQIEATIYGEVHAIAREMMVAYIDVVCHGVPAGMDAGMKLKGLLGKLMTYRPGGPE